MGWKVNKDFSELSLYNNKAMGDEQTMLEAAKHLQAAFPQCCTTDFCIELVRQCVRSEIPQEQLEDSVNWLICHHHYPTIQIADVIDYDIKLKIYTGKQAMKECGGRWDDSCKEIFKYIKDSPDGKRLYAKYDDIIMLPEKFRNQLLEFINENE